MLSVKHWSVTPDKVLHTKARFQ